MNTKTLIISGGEIDREFLNAFMENEKIDYIIAVDKGLEILDKINVVPDYIVGDFDSVNKDILLKYNNSKIKKLNPKKDFSDTHIALKLAIQLKSKSIHILGALGKRMDHALANIHILKDALDNGVECKILDSNNEIQLITNGENKIQNTQYKYISLIPLTTKVDGITLIGFKYTLDNATLEIGHSIGISNELTDNEAIITINNGILIMIKSKD